MTNDQTIYTGLTGSELHHKDNLPALNCVSEVSVTVKFVDLSSLSNTESRAEISALSPELNSYTELRAEFPAPS